MVARFVIVAFWGSVRRLGTKLMRLDFIRNFWPAIKMILVVVVEVRKGTC